MSYNRAAALAYARAYWSKACTDGYVAVKQSPYFKSVAAATIFVQRYSGGIFRDEFAQEPGGQTIPLDDLEDCSHFVSCCLGSPPNGTGGGLPVGSDFNTIYGRLSAQRLYDVLTSNHLVTAVGEKLTYRLAEPRLSQLQPGDLIFYFDGAANRYGHSAVYLAGSEKRIACHTYCRGDANSNYPQGFDSVRLDSCTLLKVN